MQKKMPPVGGLPISKGYYYALPVLVMGVIMLVMSAYKAIAFVITGEDVYKRQTWNDGLMIAEEGGASDLAGKDAIACFYEEGWQDGNCIFNQRLSLAVIPLVLL